jgi:hypothetical protein
LLNLRELIEIASASTAVDYATAKRSLPIAWLLEQHGYSLTVDGPRLKTNCPFHQDDGGAHNQTFTVHGEDLEKYGCWSCSAKGDSVNLLKHFEPELATVEGKDTPALFKRVRELITDVVDSGWTEPSGVSKQATKPFDIKAAQDLVASSQLDPNVPRIQEFVDYKRQQRGERSWPYSAQWLAEEWNVGTYGQWLIIPYYTADDNLTAYKRWTDPTKPRMAASQSSGQWEHLYGEWKEDDGNDSILLCEGESDTWYSSFHVGQDYRVLGLPLGVQSSVSAASRLSGRSVFVAFDGDEAGRGAAQRWAEALEAVECDVKIVPIPEDCDLSTAGDIRTLLSQARPLVEKPPDIKVTPGGYVRVGKEGSKSAISNWVFVPTRSLHGDGTFAFEGKLKPGGDFAVLQASDLSSDTNSTKWAAKYGRTWYGTTKDARLLLGMLQADEVFLPSGKLVTVAGLHEDTFVWPGGKIGMQPLTYLPPQASTNIEKHLKIERQPYSTELVHTLRALQAQEITDPILAWMAAAPLRSRMTAFPFIAITGGHGSGKTMTTETMLRVFTGSWVLNTFKGTPHAVTSTIASTNAFPIQLDEYRPGGRKDTLDTVEQLLREAYTEEAQQKGGLQGNWAALTEIKPSAPIVVTGEDMFTEGSHADRMIPMSMNKKHQNRQAYEILREKMQTGLPHAYLSFLNEKIADGSIPHKPIPIVPAGPLGLSTRQRDNIGILNYGWSVLQAFMAENGDSLGEPNFDGITATLGEHNKHTPIPEAINYCLGEPEAVFVRLDVKAQEVWVQVEAMYQYLSDPRRASIFVMPGRVAAIKGYLMEEMQGRVETKEHRKYIVIPYSSLQI